MNQFDTFSCPCTTCTGSTCSCGCRDDASQALRAAADACHCASACGCEAAEQGCLCRSAPAIA
jgi:hypothetical protein